MDLVKYKGDELQSAYQAWTDAVAGSAEYPFVRQGLWDEYCDVRDSLPRGTTQKRRLRKAANKTKGEV